MIDIKKDVPGYLSVVRSGKYKYLQLRQSVAKKDELDGSRTINKKVVYSFGNTDRAIDKLYNWRDNPDKFPSELKNMGYDLYDLDDWILTIETGISKTGKKIKI